MTISVNWPAKIVLSDASITDIVAFKDIIRDLEDDAEGVLYPPIITYKRVDLDGGAYFHAVDAINGYQLEFVGSGPFQIIGNINIPIIDTGVQVERKTSAAFATTSVGGSGPTAESIAAAVWQRAIEDGMSSEQMLRIMFSALAGVTSGIGTNTERYMALDGVTPRIEATFDANNNRTSITLDGA